jgi:hypothetical protein
MLSERSLLQSLSWSGGSAVTEPVSVQVEAARRERC